ncbi:MAG TPA: hypothetical protein PKA42_01810 [Candidatus Paceibacterota bacterium]|nr:hypothetical protein [Candidatus Paceibacterota bacterium]HMO82880.1 hypothetical protein [Candidatus Paceibacterota bacterium]
MINNQKNNSLSSWLIKNKVVNNEKDAQAIQILLFFVLLLIIYWFFFIYSSPAVIDRVLIENAGSPEEIINS